MITNPTTATIKPTAAEPLRENQTDQPRGVAILDEGRRGQRKFDTHRHEDGRALPARAAWWATGP